MEKSKIIRIFAISILVLPVTAAAIGAWSQQPQKVTVTPVESTPIASTIASIATSPQVPVTIDQDEEEKVVVRAYKAPNRTSKPRTQTPKYADHQWVCWWHDQEAGIRTCGYRDDPNLPLRTYRAPR